MKRFSFITFIVAMLMLSVGCSTDGQTTKADPGGVVFAEMQNAIPVIVCSSVELSVTTITDISTEFNGDYQTSFAMKPDYIIDIGPPIIFIKHKNFGSASHLDYNNITKQKYRYLYSKKC